MRHLALAFAALLLPAGSAAGQTIESAYTTFNTEKCKHKLGKDAEEDYGSWQCPGYADSPVRVAAGDQRMYISYGSSKSDDIALSQTLPGFNSASTGPWSGASRNRRPGKPVRSPPSCGGVR